MKICANYSFESGIPPPPSFIYILIMREFIANVLIYISYHAAKTISPVVSINLFYFEPNALYYFMYTDWYWSHNAKNTNEIFFLLYIYLMEGIAPILIWKRPNKHVLSKSRISNMKFLVHIYSNNSMYDLMAD